ncbi:unnamed protein product, partial [Adineta ricciae]
MLIRLIYSLLIIVFVAKSSTFALHLHGHYSSKEFFRLLTKFGIQKTDQHRPVDTFGYIYGNITLDCSTANCTIAKNLLFVILDYDYFVSVYKKQRLQSCSDMMKQIQTIAFHRQCNEKGTEDFWRRVPCERGQFCPDEDQPTNVIRNQQFTFKIQDINQPRFWYLSLISCYWHPNTCQWEKVDEDFRITYDIWVVNGNPEAKTRDNRFEYHFSYDIHDLVEVYFVCILLYLFIPLPFVLFKIRSLTYIKHPILISYFLFQLLFFLGNTFNLIHYFIFAYNGVGSYLLVHIGNLITIVGESILILLLLFIAKGWLVNATVLRDGKKMIILFILYTIACCSCYILSVLTINPLVDSNHYQTFANYFSLLFRCFVMFLFVFELKETTQEEKNFRKLQFFHHFGACCMVWFIYPTALIFIMSFVTELYRVKLIISVVTLVNFLSILIMSYILFSPKSFLNLPKISSTKHEDRLLHQSNETNGFHKSSIIEDDEDDEEDDIEVYGPSHLLLNNSNDRKESRLERFCGPTTMNSANDCHSPSMMDHNINDTTKCEVNRSEQSPASITKRLKSNAIVLSPVNESQSMKGINRKQKALDIKAKQLLQSDSNNNTSTVRKGQEQIDSSAEHIPSTSANVCQTCGEDCEEMILCDECHETFHSRCANPALSKEDIPKDVHLCASCRTKRKLVDGKVKQQKVILPFNFTPKMNLHLNGLKKNQKFRSDLEQIKASTVSNDQPPVQQPLLDTNTCAISKNTIKNESSSSLKRKRHDSSPPPSPAPAPTPDVQLDTLHRLLLFDQSGDFQGPSSSNNLPRQKYCFICRKFSAKQGPSIHCDYCPLTYHLDCLTPPLISLPKDKWMCPNHVEPTLDRCLVKRKDQSINQRVKLYQQHTLRKQDVVVQDFNQKKQTKDYFLLNTINNHRSERVDISQIPHSIAQFYSKIHSEQKHTPQLETKDLKQKILVQTTPLPDETSLAYDPCVWDILQSILNHIVNDEQYEISFVESVSIENDHSSTDRISKNECNTLDTIDVLLQALSEPRSTENQSNNLNSDLVSTNSSEDNSNVISLVNSFSSITDLSQFRLSCAALIHLHSQHVIYIRKHTI